MVGKQAALRIGFDARILNQKRRGMARYTYGLITALCQTAPQHTYIAFSDRPLAVKLPPTCEIHILPPQRGWASRALAVAVRRYHLDLLHFPANTCWFRPACRAVVTLHDINPLLDRARFGWRNYVAYLAYLTAMTTIASVLITDSHASAHEIARMFPRLGAKLKVVYPGADRGTVGTDTPPARRTPETPYLLFLGGCDPNKNLLNVVRALALVSQNDHDGVLSRLGLVVVGDCRAGTYRQQVEAELTQANLRGRTQFVGHIADETLEQHYHEASALVFPSFREGFGYPILEAQQRGLPVITSNISSMPEIAGAAALFVAPQDSVGLSAAIRQVITDPQATARLVDQGYHNTAQYVWTKTVREMNAIYEGV
jgi:glycosyltransferase involved in cell wall biosynthesis